MAQTRRKSIASSEGSEQASTKTLPKSRSSSKTPAKAAKNPTSADNSKTPQDNSHTAAKSASQVTNKEPDYEFGGPVGAFFVTFGLPLVIYALYFFCNKEVCVQSPLTFPWQRFLQSLPKNLSDLISWEAVSIYTFWMGLQLFLERVLPGEVAEGTALPDGSRLKYTMSGHLQFWVSLVLMGHTLPQLLWDARAGVWSVSSLSPLPLHLLYDHYVELITVSCLGAFALSIYLYASSFRPGLQLAHGGNTGNHIYDFFIGRYDYMFFYVLFILIWIDREHSMVIIVVSPTGS